MPTKGNPNKDLLRCCIVTSAVGCVQVREYLEKQYQELAGKEAIKLAIKALTETVEAGSKNMEVILPRFGA